MTKKEKKSRAKAVNAKGFRDHFHPYLKIRDNVLGVISETYELYGFEKLETPAVETLEALGKFLPDIDRPNEGVFAWKDETTDWLALRYDLTAPLARSFSQHKNDLTMPYKRYSYGPVWRNEKPGPDRFRQFYQCDADVVGSTSFLADAEMCMMVFDVLEKLGFSSSEFCTRISNRKILSGLIENTIGEKAKSKLFDVEGSIFRAIDKLDRLGEEGVRQLLGKGRKDQSGDFTKGTNLSESQIDEILEFLNISDIDTHTAMKKMESLIKNSSVGLEGIEELKRITEILLNNGYPDTYFKIDPSVVRGLGYYTGSVFETEFVEKNSSLGSMGSISGGGRYDNLVSRFTGQIVPATGVSLGVDRIIMNLQNKGNKERETFLPVVVTVMDKNFIDFYSKIAFELRKNGIGADLYLGNPKDFGKQLKYADSRKASYAVVAGSEEIGKNIVQIKDLNLGKNLSKNIQSNEKWKEQPAQFPVKIEDLIKTMSELIRK
tara:strand:- start:974 stop:2446 length:1473 start_codon:yes stop_codon:yes gene_type:complete